MSTFLKFYTSTPSGYLLEDTGDPGAGSPSAGAAPTSAVTPPTATSGPAQPATQATTSAPTTGAPAEDRNGWVPPYRIRETREAVAREWQTQLSQREAAHKQELDQIRSQLHALVGVQPSNVNPEVSAVRQQFAQLYPQLAKLEERGADLETLIERAGDLEAQTNHYWQSYGQQVTNRLFDVAAQSLGSQLSDEGKRQLHAQFVGYVSQSPEMQSRYTNDPTIVEDFWKQFTSNFIDPVRRASTAGIANRAAGVANLPQDTPSGQVRGTPAPKLNGLDERVAAGWAQYQALTNKQT